MKKLIHLLIVDFFFGFDLGKLIRFFFEFIYYQNVNHFSNQSKLKSRRDKMRDP